MYARVLLYTLIAGCVLFEVLSWRSVHQDQKVNIIQHWYSAVYAMYRHVGNMYGGHWGSVAEPIGVGTFWSEPEPV